METKMKFCKTEMETKFFNENGTAFSGGTGAKMEFSFPTDVEFLFYSGFAWSVLQTQYMTFSKPNHLNKPLLYSLLH
jgi:hypothetical protein